MLQTYKYKLLPDIRLWILECRCEFKCTILSLNLQRTHE